MTSNPITDFRNVPIADLVSQYTQAAEGTSNPDPKQANKSHDIMHIYYKKLRQTDAGRTGITELLNNHSPAVRCWAAAHSLAWATEQAKAVLIALRDAKGPRSFTAEMTLIEFEKGRLSFEY